MLSGRDEELLRVWLERGPDTLGGEKLFVRSVKGYYDGALGSRGARLLEGYSDRPGRFGVAGAEYGFDETLLATMMRGGFQIAVHAIGDAGNCETLNFRNSSPCPTGAGWNVAIRRRSYAAELSRRASGSNTVPGWLMAA